MTPETIRAAIAAADEFKRRAKVVVDAYKGSHEGWNGVLYPNCPSPVETGALRRQSMELTRALAAMRKP